MPSEPMKIEVHCPDCGSTDIRERNVAFALIRVLSWKREGGGVCPDEYGVGEYPDWEPENRAYQYICNECRTPWRLDDLTAAESPHAE